MLLLNTFDMAEDTINMDNLNDWIVELNRTHTELFATIASQIKPCDLEAELNTVKCVCHLCLSWLFPTLSANKLPAVHWTYSKNSGNYTRSKERKGKAT